MGKQKPADNTADDVARRQRDVDVESLDFREPGLLKEQHRVTEDGITAQDLCGPNDTVLFSISME